MDKTLFIKEVQDLISRNKLKKVLEKIIKYAAAQSANKAAWTKVENTALHNLSRLSYIENQKGLGIMKDDAYGHEANHIRWASIKLIGIIDKENFEELSTPALENTTAEQDTKDKPVHNLLDNIFKFLLLILFLVSIVILVRSLILSGHKFEERILQMSISLLGGSGAFMGYFRWRLLELKQ